MPNLLLALDLFFFFSHQCSVSLKKSVGGTSVMRNFKIMLCLQVEIEQKGGEGI